VQECGSDLAFVVNRSGGKDSTRMLGFVRKKFRDCPTHVVMADTGFEHQRPISPADFARQRYAEVGLNLTVEPRSRRSQSELRYNGRVCSNNTPGTVRRYSPHTRETGIAICLVASIGARHLHPHGNDRHPTIDPKMLFRGSQLIHFEPARFVSCKVVFLTQQLAKVICKHQLGVQ
jgi:hypothetical protein